MADNRGAQAVDLRRFLLDEDEEGLSRRAYQAVREAIMAGAFRPGDHLNIKPVAHQLGMSSMPVREALGWLAAEGAFEIIQNHGFRVPKLSPPAFREVLLMRIRLEGLAGEQAAIKVTQRELIEIAGIFERMVDAEAERFEEAMRLHRLFHFSIYAIAGMPHLIKTIEGLWLRAGPQIYESMRVQNSLSRQHHADILSALRASDPAAIVRAIRDDIATVLTPDQTQL